MSLHAFVEKEKPSILDFLKNNLEISNDLNREDYFTFTSDKIKKYVQKIFAEIKFAMQEKSCFLIEKNIYCSEDFLAIVKKIFKNCNISLDYNNEVDSEKIFQDPLSDLPQKKASHQKRIITFSWTPKNPYICGFKGVDISYQPDRLTNLILKEWEDAQEKKNTGFTIKVEDKKYYVHELYLNRSYSFQNLFKNDRTEKEKDEIEIDGFAPQIVEHFLKFLYIQKLPEDSLSASTIIDILKIAKKYNEQHLVANCCANLNMILQMFFIDSGQLQDLLLLSFKLVETQLLKVLFNYLLHDLTSFDRTSLAPFLEIVTNNNFDFFYTVAKNDIQYFPIKEELEKFENTKKINYF